MNSMVPPVIETASKPEINNGDDFQRMLATTTTEIDSLVAREPRYPVWSLLQRQLHAMQEWTAGGAEPNPIQQGRISIGLLAARELEPAPDTAMESRYRYLEIIKARVLKIISIVGADVKETQKF